MKALLSLTVVAMICGCATKSPLLTPALVQQDVSFATSIGVQFYPNAKPGIAVARDVICANAAQTNVDPNKIIADVGAAGLTNTEAKLIVNGGLLLYQQVYGLLGASNQAKALPYLQAVCSGLTQGLPGNAIAMRHVRYLKP